MMPRSLRQKRVIFTRNVAILIRFANSMGYEAAISYVKRCPTCKVGKKNSEHKNCLAVDIDLYLDGKYLENTEDHRPLGMIWKNLGGIWGGDFRSPDGNHYEYGDRLE